MDAAELVYLVLGSTVVGALISSLFTRKSAKESNDIQLLDRAYKEIERLDDRIVELEGVARDLRGKLNDVDNKYQQSETERRRLVKQLDDTLWELQETRKELNKVKEEIKGGSHEANR